MEPPVEELSEKLEKLCRINEITRFSPGEILELIEDGESVEWIVAQVLPPEAPEWAEEFAALLEALVEAVGPPEPEGEAKQAGAEEEEEGSALELKVLEDLQLPPGVDVEQLEQLMQSPQGELMADFGRFCEEKGLDPEGEEMEKAMQVLQEEWLQTPREALEGKRPAEVLPGGRLFPGRVETVRRQSPKVGRNDPCPCGSGKKYKKCCGRAA